MALAQPRKIGKLNKPARVRSGDTIAIIAPASPPLTPEVFKLTRTMLEQQGFEVVFGAHARARQGFLAGADTSRAHDLNAALRSKKVRAIVAVRGGYGVTRIVDRLDFAALRRDPKIILGCSDITALLCAGLLDGGVPTFHGPMPQSLTNPLAPEYSQSRFLDALTGGPLSQGSILEGYDERDHSVLPLRRGKVTAQLVGGNLTILCALLGTPFLPSFRGKILCIEDIGEAPFRLDRALTHLRMVGALDGVAGFALGQFINCAYAPSDAKGKQSAADVFIERLVPLGKPVVMGLPFGHGLYNATLPFGATATLDGTRGDLIIESRAVR